MADIETQRNAYVTTSLPDGRLLLEEMTGHEALGEAFEYELALLSEDPNVDLSALLGERMTVHLALADGERTFNGVVTRAQYLGTDERYTRYHVTLRPWLSLLSYSSNCRIFQDKTVPDIIKEVFRDGGFTDFRDVLGNYEPREFCVQYGESDFNFVSRLMEAEGIYYFFEHDEDSHTLVMTDAYNGHARTPGFETVVFRQPHSQAVSDVNHLSQWSLTNQIRSGSYATTDYDFKVPKADLLSRLDAPKSQTNADGALFEYPGGYLKKQAGDDLVKVRLEEKQVEFEVVAAAGDVRGLSVGALFELTEHPRDDQNKEYLVVSAGYQIHAGQFISGEGGTDEFQSTYILLDSTTPFRPSLHSHRARVEGPQTATVVGPDSEEIWTDKYGRVKVQFHWDRFGTSDENSSCWVRVSQVWAGAKWGAMHIPRIGQEVIVDFLEGDPDRPIVTGRVYNNDQMPPYDLPDNKTQSGIKSRSTPKGTPSNFNEIRFEDKKGSEELFIQAERSQTTLVKGSQSISVGGDRSVSVTGKETIDVKKTRTTTITQQETENFNDARVMNVTKTNTDTITGKMTGTYDGGREVNVKSFDDTTVNDGNKTTTVHGQFNITADTLFKVLQGSTQIFVQDQVYIDSNGEVQLKNGDGNCWIDLKGAVLTLTGPDQIMLKSGSSSISLKKDGTIEITGKTVKVTGSTEVDINGGQVKLNS